MECTHFFTVQQVVFKQHNAIFIGGLDSLYASVTISLSHTDSIGVHADVKLQVVVTAVLVLLSRL